MSKMLTAPVAVLRPAKLLTRLRNVTGRCTLNCRLGLRGESFSAIGCVPRPSSWTCYISNRSMSVNERYTQGHGTTRTDRKTVVERGSGRLGWTYANAARRRKARRVGLAMLAMRVTGCRCLEIASAFGTTRSAVAQRLYRLRRTIGEGACR